MNAAASPVLPPVERLDDPSYWHEWLRGLGIGATHVYPADPAGAPPADAPGLRADVLRHGYHIGAGGLPHVPALARGVAALTRAGLHPNWVLLTDEAWLLTRALRPLLRAAFPDLRLLSDHYLFVVDPGDPAHLRGWPPHRDRDDMGFVGPERAPQSLTVWIALTDATTANGCVYLLPASDDALYFTASDSDALADPQSALAVPVPAGTPIFWSGRVLHWGGRAAPIGPPAPPRLAFTFTAAAPDYETRDLEIDAAIELPRLAQRVDLVLSQIDNYSHRLPEFAAFVALREAFRARRVAT